MTRLGWLGVVLVAVACTEGPKDAASPDAGVADSGQLRATLTRISGSVMVKRYNGDDWQTAVEAMALYENDKVRTAAGASATVNLNTGGSVALAEDALIAISETRTRPGLSRTDVTVLKGRVDAELSDGQRQSLTVGTPSATVRAGREIVFQ
jgi:hypothetical protein